MSRSAHVWRTSWVGVVCLTAVLLATVCVSTSHAAEPAACPEGCFVGQVSVQFDDAESPGLFPEDHHSFHVTFNYSPTESEDFSIGSVRAGSLSGFGAPSILDPMGSFVLHRDATAQDNFCGDDAESQGTQAEYREDEAPPLEIAFQPNGAHPPATYTLYVGGVQVTTNGSEKYFGTASETCEPGLVIPITGALVANPPVRTNAAGVPADPTHLEGSQLVDYAVDSERDATERITWNLTFVHAPDFDGDGLSDYLEVMKYGTDPNNADTDGDGCSDGQEVAEGTNPLDPSSHSCGGSGPGGGKEGHPGEPGEGIQGGIGAGSQEGGGPPPPPKTCEALGEVGVYPNCEACAKALTHVDDRAAWTGTTTDAMEFGVNVRWCHGPEGASIESVEPGGQTLSEGKTFSFGRLAQILRNLFVFEVKWSKVTMNHDEPSPVDPRIKDVQTAGQFNLCMQIPLIGKLEDILKLKAVGKFTSWLFSHGGSETIAKLPGPLKSLVSKAMIELINHRWSKLHNPSSQVQREIDNAVKSVLLGYIANLSHLKNLTELCSAKIWTPIIDIELYPDGHVTVLREGINSAAGYANFMFTPRSLWSGPFYGE